MIDKNKPDLIGIPDPEILAQDLWSNGHLSCADAEAKGWFVTQHVETRAAVDSLLREMREQNPDTWPKF